MKLLQKTLVLNGQLVREVVKECQASQAVENLRRSLSAVIFELGGYDSLLADLHEPYRMRSNLQRLIQERATVVGAEFMAKFKIRTMFGYWGKVKDASKQE